MKRNSIILALLFSIFSYSTAIACGIYPAGGPTLQLDIANSHYDYTTDTIVANSNLFTLYAYLLINDRNKLSDTYYISAALTPKTEQPGGSFGSFSYNYTTKLPELDSQKYTGTKNVTGDMVFGNPPIEDMATVQLKDSGDLPKHDVFSTYFTEFKFQFNDADEITPYNTQNRAQAATAINLSGTGMHYKAFTFDLTGMQSGYGIHFDLYNETTKDKIENWKKHGCNTIEWPDIDVSEFAPFSHDAEGWKINPPPAVPEPSTFVLLGAGLLGAGLYRVRRRK